MISVSTVTPPAYCACAEPYSTPFPRTLNGPASCVYLCVFLAGFPSLMEVFLMFTVIFVIVASFGESLANLNGSSIDFDSFRKKFHRLYEVNSEEFSRRQIYFQNAAMRHKYLNSFPTESQAATYGINQFSDLSQMEFRVWELLGV
ncbi:hypothetical protein CHARACLAT_013169 [Characodon lateralis]|uniref:Cathepsin propeptide inhibitor domain-containing protein n=1 Tax=Characodon lateralis TaxID=208331 RepID=A0ABU7DSL3_9TELE|nr:hypothetical protein [Characodon lateralis]